MAIKAETLVEFRCDVCPYVEEVREDGLRATATRLPSGWLLHLGEHICPRHIFRWNPEIDQFVVVRAGESERG